VRVEADAEERSIGPAAVPGGDVVVAGATAFVDVAGRSVAFRLAAPPDVDRAARSAAAHAGGGPAELLAPMPGVVLAVHAAAGASVAAGDPIATIEAMKMEHVVAAPAPGRVASIEVAAGDQVVRGQVVGSLTL
jgi:acetyl-CoA/propionyl-CoA carboxylase, biotin carboxylase, biotin carboxyl carrier protein